jgi:hypothetical protein
VFKKDVTAEQAAEALEKIAGLLDLPKETNKLVNLPGNKCTFQSVPFQMIHKIEAFNDEYGRPVFYIP